MSRTTAHRLEEAPMLDTTVAADRDITFCQPVVTDVGGRYPYKPSCPTCGWSFWGYVAHHAAQGLADAHAEGRA